jgi:hypothetical protein
MLAIGMITGISLSSAQSPGAIHGKVVDENNQPMEFANVWIDIAGVKFGSSTDSLGKFVLKPVNPGTYTIHCSVVGYNELQRNIQVFPNQVSFANDLKLTVNDTLPIVIVEAVFVPLINPEETSVRTLTAKDIAHSPNIRNIDALAGSMDSGIKIGANGEAYVRGSRADAVMYIIDGVKVTNGTPSVPGAAIGLLTVYTGGVPAKYGDMTSGVIIIETKSYFDLYYEYLGSH